MTQSVATLVAPCLALFLLSACTTSAILEEVGDPAAGFSTVAARARSVTAEPAVWVQSEAQAIANRDRVRQLLAGGPIDADAAVKIAILNNRGLQAAYAEIGISSAELWQSVLPENPILSAGITGIDPVRTIEGLITANILSLITRERRAAVADIRFRQAQLRAAEATLRLAAETRRAWIRTVSAWETVAYLNQAQAAAEAASDLAERLGRTGAYTRSAQARELAFDAELAGEAGQQRMNARAAKEELTRLMGLWGPDIEYRVPDALPALPDASPTRPSVEAEALRSRVDLEIARLELEALAASHGLTEATRFVSDLELAIGKEVEKEYDEDGTTKTRSAVIDAEFAIPIFDTGQARLRKAEMTYLRAANLLAQKAIDIRSEARSAHDNFRSTLEIARHYRGNVVPLRTIVEEESLLTYNGMITSTFDLLADTRSRLDAVMRSLGAKRQFWLAQVNLDAAILGGGSASDDSGMAVAAADDSGKGH